MQLSRKSLLGASIVSLSAGLAFAQEDKKTDDHKPADPDTGENTVEETKLGLLPNPSKKRGVKVAVTHIGEVLGNPTGGLNQSAVYEDRFNFALDVDLEKLLGFKQLAFHANVFQIDAGGLSRGALIPTRLSRTMTAADEEQCRSSICSVLCRALSWASTMVLPFR